MTIRESIQRIGWRFGEAAKKANKSFVINQSDVDAINTMADYYEKTSSDNYQKNELMFKMYIWHRVEMMKHYNEDIFGTIAQKQLAETLCKPVSAFLNRFTAYLNEKEYKVLADNLNGSETPYFLLNEKQRNNSMEKLQGMLKENPDLFKTVIGTAFTTEEIQDNLIAEFNQLINVAG
jgi:hypothetical protein